MSPFQNGLLAAVIAGIGLIVYYFKFEKSQSVPPQRHNNVNHKIGVNCTNDVKIGKGAFGDVYDVTVGGNRVAVKKILLKNETVKEMAINEIEALCMCNHENIVRFQSYEYSPKEKSVFILMELCQGGTLEKWLATKNLKQRNGVQVQFWKQIVSAVQHIHYKGLIHRDLKPGNIFLSKDGEVKVGDFGLAAVIEETGFRQNMNCNMYGTHLYMAPEFSACARYDYKVDIYSLGLILFELFYHMENLNRVYMTLTNVRSNKFPNVFTQNFGKIQKLIQKMTSIESQMRLTASEVLAEKSINEDSQLYYSNLPNDWF